MNYTRNLAIMTKIFKDVSGFNENYLALSYYPSRRLITRENHIMALIGTAVSGLKGKIVLRS